MCSSSHLPANQLDPKTAAYPKVPDASVYIERFSDEIYSSDKKIDFPLKILIKDSHVLTFERASLLIHMK